MTPAIQLLKKRKIAHRINQYDASDTRRDFGDHAANALNQNQQQVLKTLIAIIDGNTRKPVVAMVAVANQLDLKLLAAAAGGRKATMADTSLAQKVTGYVIGGISPLAQRQSLPTYLDSRAKTFDKVFISGGRRGLQVELNPHCLIDLTDAVCCSIATPVAHRSN